jgi:site-specific DNA-methyltransferase (adenine-specific)
LSAPTWVLNEGDAFATIADMADGAVTHVITDPPYGARTHDGQRSGRRDSAYADGWVASVGLGYDHLEPEQAKALAAQFSRVATKWNLVMTSHDLFSAWEAGFTGYTFAPLPIVLKGMNVRLAGDGPSSWCVWLTVNRRTGVKDGTKPGAYVGSPGDGPSRATNIVKGHKPLWLMEELIRDYTQPGDTVLDPFCGSGTTGLACLRLGRNFVGVERDPKHLEFARRRLAGEPLEIAGQAELFARGVA